MSTTAFHREKGASVRHHRQDTYRRVRTRQQQGDSDGGREIRSAYAAMLIQGAGRRAQSSSEKWQRWASIISLRGKCQGDLEEWCVTEIQFKKCQNQTKLNMLTVNKVRTLDS